MSKGRIEPCPQIPIGQQEVRTKGSPISQAPVKEQREEIKGSGVFIL